MIDLEFCERLGDIIGKSELWGINAQQARALVALAMAEGRSVSDVLTSHCVVRGRLARHAHAMLADFGRIGGTWAWREDGSRGGVATLYAKIGDREATVSYSLADAEAAGLCGPGGSPLPGQRGPTGWQRDRAAQLRARCITRAMRMIAPQTVSGLGMPEDVVDETEASETQAQAHGDAAPPPSRTGSAEAQRETQAQASSPSSAPPPPPAADDSLRVRRQELRARLARAVEGGLISRDDAVQLVELHGGRRQVLTIPRGNLDAFERELTIVESRDRPTAGEKKEVQK